MVNRTIATTLRRYYWLTKPGIIYGNLLAAVCAYIFGAKSFGSISVFFGLAVGVSFVIACGCILNNIFDRDIDAHMKRTRKRSLVTNKISVRSATIFAVILGILGFLVLLLLTNHKTALCGLVGLVFYVPIYTVAKRKTVHGTLIGTISGATPPVAGYVAATNRFDIIAFLLFLILVTWQMPHFYAIAIRRLQDYKGASIPVLPAVKGISVTKRHMVLYIAGFIIATVLFTIYSHAGYPFGVLILATGLRWMMIALGGYRTLNKELWAKSVFLFSLVSLLAVNALLVMSVYVN